VSRRPDAPSLGVVAAGGIGVLAVVAFVAALAFGGSSEPSPGERVRLVRADAPAGIAVLAGRCLDQRVTAVEVDDEDGRPLWRIESEKGSIERRYLVGAPAPFLFRDDIGLIARPRGRVRAAVTFADGGETTTDAVTVDVDGLPAEGGELERLPPPCGGRRDLGATTLLFAAAALVVVVGYGVMLARFAKR